MKVVEEVYKNCKEQLLLPDNQMTNGVQGFYAPFSAAEISVKIAQIIKTSSIQAEVDVIYQTVENLHIACPENLGDWYFTGNYPTPGGNRVVNQAFVNFYEGRTERAY
jgi:amidophosphoribosyltransferase